MSDSILDAYNISDLREIARRRLPKGMFEFVDRGTEDEVALRNNRAAFERIKLVPRTLVNVADRNQEITLFGNSQAMPIAIAPTGTAGLLWYDGEIALARAARAAGIPFTLSTASMTALERIVNEAGGRLWFQLYMWPDRSLSHQLIERARVAGFEALIVTVDSAVTHNREYNTRNGFTVPFRLTARNVSDVLMHPHWLVAVLTRYLLTTGMPRYENFPPAMQGRITAAPMGKGLSQNASLNWDDIRQLRKLWPHTLMLKGVLHPHDASLAADCGVDAVIVSNHGGRNLDSTMAPIDVLPRIVDAVGKRITVIVDSGFVRGSDVIKGLALGANAVLVGRGPLFGAAAGGEAGAARAIGFYREEIDRVMALVGVRRVADLNRDYVIIAGQR